MTARVKPPLFIIVLPIPKHAISTVVAQIHLSNINNGCPLVPGARALIPGHLSLSAYICFSADLYPTFSHVHELSHFSFLHLPSLSSQSVRSDFKI